MIKVTRENVIAVLSVSRRTFENQGPFHWHPKTELCYISEGKCDFYVNGTHYVGGAGDLLIFKSGDIHCFTPIGGKCVTYLCLFEPALIYNQSVKMPFVKTYISRAELEGCGISDKIIDILGEMLFEKKSAEPYHEVILESQAVTLYAMLARYFADTSHIEVTDPGRFEVFQKILDYIFENYARDISLKDIAGLINYSESNVSGMFSKFFGTNFKSYLNNIRVNKSIELLTSTSDSITNIAMKCGFNNIRTFNGVFKKITGITPSDMKRQQNN